MKRQFAELVTGIALWEPVVNAVLSAVGYEPGNKAGASGVLRTGRAQSTYRGSRPTGWR